MSGETEKVTLSVEEIVAKDIKKEEAVIQETKKTVAEMEEKKKKSKKSKWYKSSKSKKKDKEAQEAEKKAAVEALRSGEKNKVLKSIKLRDEKINDYHREIRKRN